MKDKDYLMHAYNATSIKLETYQHWLERQLLSRIEVAKESKAGNLPAFDVSKSISCYVAKNKNEFDVENMSFYKKKSTAKQVFGNTQEIVKAIIIF